MGQNYDTKDILSGKMDKIAEKGMCKPLASYFAMLLSHFETILRNSLFTKIDKTIFSSGT